MAKSTPEQIRRRFDADVERFSNLETGQSATIDAERVLNLVAATAAATNPTGRALLDIGCGAGNYTLKLLQKLPLREITLIDLSQPMLNRAKERITQQTNSTVTVLQGDIRNLSLGDMVFDVVVAAAVLHHLREDDEWRGVFEKIYQCLKPRGSFWITDLIQHSIPAIQAMMWERYGEYLSQLKGEKYRDEVFAYIELEDTPKPVLFQLDLLRQTGFSHVEILHKNNCFAAFGAIK